MYEHGSWLSWASKVIEECWNFWELISLWTRITAKSAGVWFPKTWFSMFWGLGKARNMKRSTIIILAFYFIDPFPMFLVKDHFSQRRSDNRAPSINFSWISIFIYLPLEVRVALLLDSVLCLVLLGLTLSKTSVKVSFNKCWFSKN